MDKGYALWDGGISKSTGNKIKRRLKEERITYAVLAGMIGIKSAAAICYFLSGKSKSRKIKTYINRNIMKIKGG